MMSTPVLLVSGLADHSPIALDRLVGTSLDDADEPVLVPLVDLLAAIRMQMSAEILLVEFAGGASVALHVRRILASGDVHVLIDPTSWEVRIVDTADPSAIPTCAAVGVQVLSFASFVGGGW